VKTNTLSPELLEKRNWNLGPGKLTCNAHLGELGLENRTRVVTGRIHMTLNSPLVSEQFPRSAKYHPE
jgi:hypothetical protein